MRALVVAAVCLLATVARAQVPEGAAILPKDPRVAPAAIDLLGAQITYQNAVIGAMSAEAMAKAEWWGAYVKGLAPASPEAK